MSDSEKPLDDDIEIADTDDEIEDIVDIEDIELAKELQEEHVSDDSLKLYFKHINQFSPLSMEEEQKLGIEIRAGDKNAIKKLITANLKFVVSIANKYKNSGVPIADLINQGNLGLIEAARRYDPDKGVKFITYAVWWIRQAIAQGLTEQLGSVRLPVKQANILYKINAKRERLTKELHRSPTDDEIAAAAGVSIEDMNDIMRVSKGSISLDAPMAGSDDDDRSFIDTLEASAPDIADEIISKTLRASVDEIVSDLKPREASIIMQRFGLEGNGNKTLEEIGQEMNISRERVRQIEAKALASLRKKALRKRLNDFLN